jgi:predicted transcriptional regulator
MLNAVWELGDCTVSEVLEHWNSNIAYTTAMTTLNRLFHKHLLRREREGRAFRYTPCFSIEEMQRTSAGQLIRQLLHSAATATSALSYIVEAVTEHDDRLLDELQEIVEQKRRRLSSLDEQKANT